jgi:hypothetical protein
MIFVNKFWKVVCGHELKLCCEVVHCEGSNAMEIFLQDDQMVTIVNFYMWPPVTGRCF